jgi:hypothetical protein
VRLGSPVGRRLTALVISVIALMAASCVHRTSTITQDEASARISTGPALNTTTATYELADVRLTLEKVVALAEGMLGLGFSFGDASPDCCSLFPRAALAGEGGAPSNPTDIVIPAADAQANGKLPMHIWIRATGDNPSFKVDLPSLGVPTS